MYLVGDVISYNTRRNGSRYNNKSLIDDTDSIERLFNIKYGTTYGDHNDFYFKIIPEDESGRNYIEVDKKEIKNYLQDKKFMLEFENKLKD